MPRFEVEKDGQRFEVEVPEGVDPSAAIAQYLQPQQPKQMSFLDKMSAVNPIADLGRGVAETALGSAVGLADTATAGIKGLAYGLRPGDDKWFDPDVAANTANKSLGRWNYEPQSKSGQAIQSVSNYVGDKIERGSDWAGEASKGGVESRNVGATAVKTGLQVLPMALGIRSKSVRGPLKSTKDIKAEARQAYQSADAAGTAVNKSAYSEFANRALDRMTEAGIDKGLHKKGMRALDRIIEDEGQHITLKGLQRIRQNIGDAVDAAKGKGDRRMAMILRNEFDDWLKALKEKDLLTGERQAIDDFYRGNELYSRASKAEEIEGLVEKAKNNAPTFSASGYENSLRTQMKNLANNEGKLRRYSPQEQKLIKQAARGNLTTRVARNVGRFMPTGVVSSMPTAALWAAGGPMTAGAFAVGTAGARGIAAMSRKAQVNKILEAIKRGEQVPESDLAMALATVLSEQGVQNGP